MSTKQQADVAKTRIQFRLIEEYRKLYNMMPMQQAATLLQIALEPGITVTDLAEKTGLTMASASRNIEVLGPWQPKREIGMGLIQNDYSDEDRRKKTLTLTAKGWRVINTMNNILG